MASFPDPFRPLPVVTIRAVEIENYYIAHAPVGAGGIGGLLAAYYPQLGTWNYLHGDALGNIVLASSSNGQTVATYRYTAAGRLINRTGDYVSRFLHASKEYDPETRLYYYGYRYLSPQLTRWTSREPLGEAASINLFSFCHSDPLNRYDYLGLQDQGAINPDYWQKYYTGAGLPNNGRGWGSGGSRITNPKYLLPATTQTKASPKNVNPSTMQAASGGGGTSSGSKSVDLRNVFVVMGNVEGSGKSECGPKKPLTSSITENNPNIVYRRLHPSERETAFKQGLESRSPGSTITPTMHIEGERKSPFISATRDYDVALKYDINRTPIVEIDLSRINGSYIDFTQPANLNALKSAQSIYNAVRDAEVLIQGAVPPQAIGKVYYP